jgi:hypothetical protein
MDKRLPILAAFALFVAAGCDMGMDDTAKPAAKTDASVPDKPKSEGMVTTPSADDQAKLDGLTAKQEAAAKAMEAEATDATKKAFVETSMELANYLTFDAPLAPREKYRPALKLYNKVLEIEPDNEKAKETKKVIEDIYASMGMPVPQD